MATFIHICHAVYRDDKCANKCEIVGLFSNERKLTNAKKVFRKSRLHMRGTMKFSVTTHLLDSVA